MMSEEAEAMYSEYSPPRRRFRRSCRSFFSPERTPVKSQRETRAVPDDDLEVGGVAARGQAVDGNRHVFEVALRPEAADDVGDVVARDADLDALAEAGNLDDLVGAEDAVALDRDAGDEEFPRTGIIHLEILRLGPQQERGRQQEAGEEQLQESSHRAGFLKSLQI